ncbi:MAG TPA: radical SAM protein, partial [Bacillota bacterium]|nr:radical SAM protein [Bacillota bacterium]
MKVFLDCEQHLGQACHDIVRIFYPDVEFVMAPAGADFSIRLSELPSRQVTYEASLTGGDSPLSVKAAVHPLTEEALHNRQRRTAKLAVLKLLEAYTGQSGGPWGILTGIRPTKIVHRLLDQGYTTEEAVGYLTSGFRMTEAKSKLLTQVAQLQRPFLHSSAQAGNLVSIYIGIPFCPTRCVYCSFPAYSIKAHARLVQPFASALLEEIRETGKLLQATHRKVETIYVGGGTPTSLPLDLLQQLMEAINQWLKGDVTREFTVEAGRPDTINEEVLAVLLQSGV